MLETFHTQVLIVWTNVHIRILDVWGVHARIFAFEAFLRVNIYIKF